MKILMINNNGGGFADYIEVKEWTTVQQCFEEQMPDQKAEDFLIRVNRNPVNGEQILHEGDRISITPLKIEGAFKESRLNFYTIH